MSERRGIIPLTFVQQLARANKAIPNAIDSKGQWYYLGLRSGQMISYWWGENSGLCNKIIADIKLRNVSNEEILTTYQGEYKDLCEESLEWLRNRIVADETPNRLGFEED